MCDIVYDFVKVAAWLTAETSVARGTVEDCSRRPKLAEALPVLYVRKAEFTPYYLVL